MNESLQENKRRAKRTATSVIASGTLPEGMTESKARTLNLVVKTERETINLKKEKGQLLDADEVKAAAFNCARATRDAVMGVPERVSDQLAVMNDAFEIRLMLRRELETALKQEAEEHS